MFKPEKIGIIGGKGILGSFLANFFKKQGYKVLISDLKTPLSNLELTKQCDVTIFCVPIHVTREVIREVSKAATKEKLLMDVTSLKTFPIREMLKSKASVIGLHPTFLPNPKTGFRNQHVVMCTARACYVQKNWIHKLLKKDGANVISMTPAHHDRLMGIMQVLVHFHTILFGSVLLKLKAPLQDTLKIMSPVYRLEFDLMARIFAQDPMLYASIEMQNPETKKILRTLQGESRRLTKLIEEKDDKKFVREFKKIRSFLGSFTSDALRESNEILTYFSSKHKM